MKYYSLLMHFNLPPKSMDKLLKLAGLDVSRTKNYSQADYNKLERVLGKPHHTFIAEGSGEKWAVRRIDYYPSIKASVTGDIVDSNTLSLFSTNAKISEFMEYEEIRRKKC